MTITPSMIYWITRLDYLITIFGILNIINVIFFTVFCVLYFKRKEVKEGLYEKKVDYEHYVDKEFYKCKLDGVERELKRLEEDMKNICKKIYKIIIITATFTIMLFLTPTTKEAAAMYIIPAISNNKQVQKLPENLLKYTNELLKDKIKSTVKSTIKGDNHD